MTFIDYILFHLARDFAQLVWAIGIALLVVAAYLVMQIPRVFRQAMCKHERVFETGRCHAVCIECRKNLGFIGTWREKQKR